MNEKKYPMKFCHDKSSPYENRRKPCATHLHTFTIIILSGGKNSSCLLISHITPLYSLLHMLLKDKSMCLQDK